MCSKQHTLRTKTLQKVMIRSAVVENYTGRSLARGNRKAGVTKNLGVAFQTSDLVKDDAVNSTHMTRKGLHQKDYSALSSPILGTRTSYLCHEGLRRSLASWWKMFLELPMCDGSVALSAPFLEDQRSISKLNVPVNVGRSRQPSCVPCWECRHRQ